MDSRLTLMNMDADRERSFICCLPYLPGSDGMRLAWAPNPRQLSDLVEQAPVHTPDDSEPDRCFNHVAGLLDYGLAKSGEPDYSAQMRAGLTYLSYYIARTKLLVDVGPKDELGDPESSAYLARATYLLHSVFVGLMTDKGVRLGASLPTMLEPGLSGWEIHPALESLREIRFWRSAAQVPLKELTSVRFCRDWRSEA
jgi:hypothetical protein